jgi:tetratricopeptide (TPR) repeat protein
MDTYRQQNQVETITGSSEDSLHPVTTAAAWCDPSAYPLTLSSVSDQALSACAIKAVHQKQYAWALHLLNQLIQRHPQEANFYSNRGLLHLWCGHPDTALNDCNYAIELKPDLDQAYNNRANCYAALGLSVKALVDYERAVDFNPFNSRARINLGVTLRHLGDLDAALECFDEALLFYKLSAIIYAERGRTYHLRGDWNCAIADYRRALTVLAQGSETPQQKRLQKRIQAWIDDLLPEPDQP